jgi:hypothetical protein
MRLLVAGVVVSVLVACGQDDAPQCTPIAVAPHNCGEKGCIGDAWSSDKGDYGATCKVAADCGSGLCAFDPNADLNYCTQTCEPKSEPPCPRGAGCFAASDGKLHVCSAPVQPARDGVTDDLCK